MAPLGWLIVVDQGRLRQKRIFLKYLVISIIVLVLGLTLHSKNFENRDLSYFGSQMMFVFVLLHGFLSEICYRVFHRVPEISKVPRKNIDIIYSIIIVMGVILLPFVVDIYIVKKVIE